MDKTFLVFGHHGARYGLDVRAVREIVWLPELSPIEELPAYFVGVFNRRGRIVPVMDLGLRFGHPREHSRLTDQVILIEVDAMRMGIVANELHDVAAVLPEHIEDAQGYQEGLGAMAQFVGGVAKLGDGLAMLLDIDALLRSAPPEEALSAPAPPGSAVELSPLFGKLPPEDVEVLRSRARSLTEVQGIAERAGLEAFAVIRLAGERFGLGLDLVREFAHLRSIVPVPCCPPHILGNMNLRGDILTLVDLRPALGMSTEGEMSVVVVARIGELRLGLPAAEIVDVVQLAPSDIAAVPVASDRAGKAYCKGVATVGDHTVGILDLAKMLAAGELRVAETP